MRFFTCTYFCQVTTTGLFIAKLDFYKVFTWSADNQVRSDYTTAFNVSVLGYFRKALTCLMRTVLQHHNSFTK